MRPGNHAAGDGSFGRSAGGAAGRGIALLALAVLLGIILLNATDEDPPGTRVTTGSQASVDDGDDEEGDDGEAAVASTTSVPPTTLPAHPPKEVKVIVVNASGVKGAAGKASDLLKPPGYNVLAPTNASRGETIVYFAPGYDADAAAVAAALGFPPASLKPLPTPPPIPDSKGAHIVVMVGADQGSRFGAAPAATTTSTTAGATTTTKKP
ncbi:MAG: LytR C-terminal domain-containing protein [Actinobacteria bacterium]|nr:LytR C-terminal domain-containing protein [Actinomycetota bacterium]MBW3650161.1 LytR C-terminal domain-containing protein [Actinomycetota bacterium]